jgi:hypothetical protein
VKNMGISRKTENNVEEAVRRFSVATLHRTGTEIRKAELERMAMQATILKGIAEGHYESLISPDGLRSPMDDFTKLLNANEDDEVLKGLLSLYLSLPQHMGAMQNIEELLQSVNRLREQLEREGAYFEFPKFALVIPTRDMAKIQLRSAIGFLDGIITSAKTK